MSASTLDGTSKGLLDDGFGNIWEKCEMDDCCLEIVRPGKVQCVRCQYADEQPLRNVDG